MKIIVQPKNESNKPTEIVSFRQLASEFIGTFVWVFFTLWSRICVDLFKVDYVEVAITSGFTFML